MNDNEPLGPRLELIAEDQTARCLSLKKGVIQIGRDPSADVRFLDTRVSRWHARVEPHEDEGYYLVDTSKYRATFLNGRRVEGSRPVPLHDGDTIRVADHEMVFRSTEQILLDEREGGATVVGTLADLTSFDLSRSSPRPADALRAVLEVNRALGGGGDLNELLGRALDSLMKLIPKTGSCLIVTAEPDGRLPVRASRNRGGPIVTPALSRTILEKVLHRGEAVLIEDVAADSRFRGRDSVEVLFRTALCVPLPGHDGPPVGMVQLAGMRDRFNKDDLELLAALAWPLAVAVENDRLLRERASWDTAREIQRALLPRERPEIPGYTFWECYRPALTVGGDLYDYIRVDRDGVGNDPRWVVCIGDVAGKGIPAALMSAAVSPEVRHTVWSGAPPAEVLARVNRHVHKGGFDSRFVTMILAELDPREHRLTLANAGHERPLLRLGDGKVERLELPGTGPPLGVISNAVYRPFTLHLEPGEVLVLHSDGLSDAHDVQGRRFGQARAERTLADALAGVTLSGEGLLDAVSAHARGRSSFDDLTIVCFGREDA